MTTIREYKKELLVYLTGTLILDAVYLLLLFLFRRLYIGVWIGIGLGSLVSVLNFISMFFSKTKVIEKPEGAKARYRKYYTLRLLVIGVLYILFFQIPGISLLSLLLPLLYPKLIYYTLAFAGRGDLI